MTYPVTPSPTFSWGGTHGGLRDLPAAVVAGPMVHFADVTSQIDSGGVTPLTGGPTRGIWVDAAGTITGHDAYGNAFSAIPVQAGYNPICIGGITSVATLTKVWAVY